MVKSSMFRDKIKICTDSFITTFTKMTIKLVSFILNLNRIFNNIKLILKSIYGLWWNQ